jgi:nitrate reductase gamma subunit
MVILIYRRRTTGPVFSATTRMDKVMYVFLASVIVLGLLNTVMNVAGDYNYREGVSVWFRGIFRFQLHPELMSDAPLGFQLLPLLLQFPQRALHPGFAKILLRCDDPLLSPGQLLSCRGQRVLQLFRLLL